MSLSYKLIIHFFFVTHNQPRITIVTKCLIMRGTCIFVFLLLLVETGSEDFSDFNSLHVPLFNSNKTIWAILFIMVYTPCNACLETHLDWRYLSPKRARVWDKTCGTHLGRLSYTTFVLLWIKIKSLCRVRVHLDHTFFVWLKNKRSYILFMKLVSTFF